MTDDGDRGGDERAGSNGDERADSGDGEARSGPDGAGAPASDAPPDTPPPEPDLDYLVDHLEELEDTVDSPEEREQVRYALRVARRIPGTSYLEAGIQKYTTRDMAEAFVGAILLALPLLVEGGVFEIAQFLAETRVAGVPVYLVGNVLFVVVLTIGLLYWADFREIQITRPIFGVVPRRLVGVLSVTLLTSVFLIFLWGRHLEGDPTRLELVARVSVVWAAAAIGGALGDILPGESEGHDVTVENLDEIVRRD